VNRRLAAAVAALAGAVAYTALGRAVAHAPPDALDRAGRALAGEATPLAIVFTASCWWPVLVSAAVVSLILGVAVPAWRVRALTFPVVLVVAWKTSDVLKDLFARPRPEYWVAIRESTYAYSSGHAMFAVLVYGAGAWYVLRSGWAPALRLPLAAVLFLWACGVIWSRLALGAHYVTDLVGGVILGLTIVSVTVCVGRRQASVDASWHRYDDGARRGTRSR
jgi:undecaprenyl-diphosphatase